VSQISHEQEQAGETDNTPSLFARNTALLRVALLGNLTPPTGDNDGLDAAKLIAIVLMIASHTMIALPAPWLYPGYLIGRPCIPIFVFLIAARLADGGPERSERMLTRLLLWGIAAQPIYYALRDALTPGRQNVLLTLAVGVALVHCVRTRRHWWTALIVILSIAGADFLEGGLTPFAMLGGTLLFRKSRVAALALVVMVHATELLLISGFKPAGAVAALAALPIILISPAFTSIVPRLPGVFFYAIYPAHLLVILIVFGPYHR